MSATVAKKSVRRARRAAHERAIQGVCGANDVDRVARDAIEVADAIVDETTERLTRVLRATLGYGERGARTRKRVGKVTKRKHVRLAVAAALKGARVDEEVIKSVFAYADDAHARYVTSAQ